MLIINYGVILCFLNWLEVSAVIDVVVVIVPDTKNIYYLSPNSLELKCDDEVIFEN